MKEMEVHVLRSPQDLERALRRHLLLPAAPQGADALLLVGQDWPRGPPPPSSP